MRARSATTLMGTLAVTALLASACGWRDDPAARLASALGDLGFRDVAYAGVGTDGRGTRLVGVTATLDDVGPVTASDVVAEAFRVDGKSWTADRLVASGVQASGARLGSVIVSRPRGGAGVPAGFGPVETRDVAATFLGQPVVLSRVVRDSRDGRTAISFAGLAPSPTAPAPTGLAAVVSLGPWEGEFAIGPGPSGNVRLDTSEIRSERARLRVGAVLGGISPGALIRSLARPVGEWPTSVVLDEASLALTSAGAPEGLPRPSPDAVADPFSKAVVSAYVAMVGAGRIALDAAVTPRAPIPLVSLGDEIGREGGASRLGLTVRGPGMPPGLPPMSPPAPGRPDAGRPER